MQHDEIYFPTSTAEVSGDGYQAVFDQMIERRLFCTST